MNKMHRYRWYNSFHFGPCYDPETKAHYCNATDVETLVNTYPNIDPQSLQVNTGNNNYVWASDLLVCEGGLIDI